LFVVIFHFTKVSKVVSTWQIVLNLAVESRYAGLGVKQQQSSRIAELGVKPRSGLSRLGVGPIKTRTTSNNHFVSLH